jgi:hypothetical protein
VVVVEEAQQALAETVSTAQISPVLPEEPEETDLMATVVEAEIMRLLRGQMLHSLEQPQGAAAVAAVIMEEIRLQVHRGG